MLNLDKSIAVLKSSNSKFYSSSNGLNNIHVFALPYPFPLTTALSQLQPPVFDLL